MNTPPPPPDPDPTPEGEHPPEQSNEHVTESPREEGLFARMAHARPRSWMAAAMAFISCDRSLAACR